MEEIKIPNHKDIKTLQDLREYQKQVSKRWYQKNREKKIAYQLDRYHKRIAELKEKEEASQ